MMGKSCDVHTGYVHATFPMLQRTPDSDNLPNPTCLHEQRRSGMDVQLRNPIRVATHEAPVLLFVHKSLQR